MSKFRIWFENGFEVEAENIDEALIKLEKKIMPNPKRNDLHPLISNLKPKYEKIGE